MAKIQVSSNEIIRKSNFVLYICVRPYGSCNRAVWWCTYLAPEVSVANPYPFDSNPDPYLAFHCDTDLDPDPAFQFDTYPGPTVWYRSGSFPFKEVMCLKQYLFIHLSLIFLVSRSNRTQLEGINIPIQLILLGAWRYVHPRLVHLWLWPKR